jgi:uncharacterized protein (TIGR03083 family)
MASRRHRVGVTVSAVDVDAGALYRTSRTRLIDHLRELDDEIWSASVPACPGWDVRAVVSHVVANADDALAGRLTGLPTDEQTADQVARFASRSPGELLDLWSEQGPRFDEVVSRLAIWPAALDALTHEHDIYAAIGVAGARDDGAFRIAAHVLVDGAELTSATLAFDLDDEELSTVDVGGPRHRARTTAFEITRIRLGRRSRDQVLALPWSPPLTAVPDGLFVFGPRPTALDE